MNGRISKQTNTLQKVWKAAKRILGFLLVTLLLICVGLYGVMWVLMKGPSPTARKLFTLSVRETSAVGFLANLYLPESEIEEIVGSSQAENGGETTDSTLISVNKTDRDTDAPEEVPEESAGNAAQEQTDEDAGIKIEKVKGSSYEGVMMTIDDPSRIFVGTPGAFGEGSRGLTLSEMIESSGAVGGINAGGFYDPGGGGNGGIPDGLVICDGKLAWGGSGSYSVIGFDEEGILHVGAMTAQEALNAGIRWAVSFGPALIVNGTPCSGMSSGVNPRTAIGQRSDGAVLMLVIDGRQVGSLGATFEDVADIMLDYGAVNAANLDGGSSTLMIYKGETLNECASVYGPRKIATSFLIK